MGRPYDLYLRFLLTKGIHETEAVNAALEELGLPKVTDEEIDHQDRLVYDHVPKPVQNQMEHQVHDGDFRRWMKFLEVNELWGYEKKYRTQGDLWIKLVYDLHSDPKLKLTIGALLMKGVRDTDIVQMVNLKYGAMLKQEHVNLYQKFFWNTTRMTRGDWKAYMKHLDSYEKIVLFTCLSEDVEAVKVALDLPSKSHVSDMLQSMLSMSYQKARQYLRYNSEVQNIEARKWIDTTIKLIDKYEKHRTGDVDDFGKSLQMEFDYVDSQFMTPDEQMKLELEADRKKLEAKKEQ